jgi:hypothetical protein
MGRFWYMFKYIKKLKLELIKHNLGTGYVRLIPISTFLLHNQNHLIEHNQFPDCVRLILILAFDF